MSSKTAAALWILATVLCGAAAGGQAETPEQVFEGAFGEQARKVAASANPRNSAAFAVKLYEAAVAVDNFPKLQALLCRKAYDFAVKGRSGYATALSALELLGKADKNAREELDEKTRNVYRLMKRSGTAAERRRAAKYLLSKLIAGADADMAARNCAKAILGYGKAYQLAGAGRSAMAAEILGKLKDALARDKALKEIARQTGLLRESPGDTDLAMQLIGLCLVENVDPAKVPELAKLAEDDEKTSRGLVLAGKDMADLAPEALLELGEWYRFLADKAARNVKAKLLLKAQACYEKFLELTPEKDVRSLEVKATLALVDKELDKLLGSRRFRKGWNLVAEFKPLRNPNGQWSYGWAPQGAQGSFKRYSRFSKDDNGSPYMSTPGKSSVGLNTSKVAQHGVVPGELWMHGGEKGDLAIVRWTSPLNGTVKVTGAFGAGNSGTVDAYVMKVGLAGASGLFRKVATARREPFGLMVRIRKGEKIDFILGTAGDWGSDSTPLSVVIVPKGL